MGSGFRPLVFAIRNSFRRRARLALTLVTLAAGGLFFLTALNVRASMMNTIDRMFAPRKFDLTVALRELYDVEKLQSAIDKTPGIKRAEGWLTTEASLGSDRFGVVALPPDSQLLKSEILEGRDLVAGDTDAIVINQALAGKLRQMRVGQTIALRIGGVEKEWRVIGLAREAFSPPTGYVPLGSVPQPQLVNSLRLSLDQTNEDSLEAVRAGLDRNLERQGMRARSSSTTSETRFVFDQHMLMIYVFFIVMAAIVGAVGGLGLMTTMSLNVLERRREMGVLRAIGATPRIVWLMVIAEGLVIGVLSWEIAAVLAWPVSKVVGDTLVRALFRGGLDFSFEALGLVIWLGISIVLSAVASFLPAWRASRTTVREALAYE
jgi:putative ABC transport system permease protein